MQHTPKFHEGQAVEVLIHDSALNQAVWNRGFVVTGIVQALDDKPYRVAVNDGRRFYADADPECVRALNTAAGACEVGL